MGLYLYSTGSQCQLLAVMSHVSLSESYDAVIARKWRRKKKKSQFLLLGDQESILSLAETEYLETKGGSLRQLSHSMIDMAQHITSTGLYGTSYNNINMVFQY